MNKYLAATADRTDAGCEGQWWIEAYHNVDKKPAVMP